MKLPNLLSTKKSTIRNMDGTGKIRTIIGNGSKPKTLEGF